MKATPDQRILGWSIGETSAVAADLEATVSELNDKIELELSRQRRRTR
jgi:hypothetical protein